MAAVIDSRTSGYGMIEDFERKQTFLYSLPSPPVDEFCISGMNDLQWLFPKWMIGWRQINLAGVSKVTFCRVSIQKVLTIGHLSLTNASESQ
jgi:hypothetical protein